MRVFAVEPRIFCMYARTEYTVYVQIVHVYT